jgi:hypothetical protein
MCPYHSRQVPSSIQELPLTLLGSDPPISQPTTAWVAPLADLPGLTP